MQGELYELLLEWIGASSPTGGRPAEAEIRATVLSWAIFGAGLEWSRRGGVGSAEE